MSVDCTLAAAIGDAGTGAVTVMKSGPGNWVLTGNNTYTGDTTVMGGTLSLSSAGLADASDVAIAGGAVLDLNFPDTQVDLVASLTLGDAAAQPGIWGAEGSGAPHTSPMITGTGRIRVAGPFEAWAAGIANAGLRDRAADPDGDGFSNLLEYLFGSPGTAANGSLVQTSRTSEGLVLRWNELAAGGSYQLQESSALAENPWPASRVTPVTAADQSGVPANYIRKEATVPVDDERKFLRVNGTEN